MKLILVPSNPKHGPRVAISIANDGGVLSDFLSDVVVPALVAYGWHPQSIQDAMHDVEVPGARKDVELADDMTEWSTPVSVRPGSPTPPGGFTIVGYGVDLGEELEFNIGDLVFSASGSIWTPTHLVNGYNVWYAARDGSDTLATIQSILAAR